MIRLLLVFALVACHKSEQVKEQIAVSSTAEKQIDKAEREETVKATEETVRKTSGPTEVHDLNTTELFGWAPPPPEAPKGTPSRWVPIKRVVDDKTVKAASTVTERQSGTQQQTEALASSKEVAKADVVITAKKIATKEFGIGLSWQVKLAIAVFAVVVVLAIIAWLNPNILGLPVRALRWIVARWRGGPKP